MPSIYTDADHELPSQVDPPPSAAASTQKVAEPHDTVLGLAPRYNGADQVGPAALAARDEQTSNASAATPPKAIREFRP